MGSTAHSTAAPLLFPSAGTCFAKIIPVDCGFVWKTPCQSCQFDDCPSDLHPQPNVLCFVAVQFLVRPTRFLPVDFHLNTPKIKRKRKHSLALLSLLKFLFVKKLDRL